MRFGNTYLFPQYVEERDRTMEMKNNVSTDTREAAQDLSPVIRGFVKEDGYLCLDLEITEAPEWFWMGKGNTIDITEELAMVAIPTTLDGDGKEVRVGEGDILEVPVTSEKEIDLGRAKVVGTRLPDCYYDRFNENPDDSVNHHDDYLDILSDPFE